MFDLRPYIRDVADFPKPGILFKDVTPLLTDSAAFRATIDELKQRFAGRRIDVVAAAEARGFIFGAPLALELGAGFVPIRKPGKLPYAKIAVEYQLEYGRDCLEVHADALKAGARVLLLDDVLATGGTIKACRDLIVQSGAHLVACAFIIELAFLNGRDVLGSVDVESLVTYV
jgi:adenine phosphoribosyltransferase